MQRVAIIQSIERFIQKPGVSLTGYKEENRKRKTLDSHNNYFFEDLLLSFR
jgi:hypothetical protein